MQLLKAAGIRPKKHVLDNECSTEFKQAIKENELEYELLPKGQNRRNISERALQTWRSHTIGALSGVSENSPLSLWDELLSQLDMQVNLLRFSNVNPKVFSWIVLNGAHDFNMHPLALLGVEIQMLENHDKKKTWGVRSKPGYYVGTSLERYRYYWGWMRETKKIRGSETVSLNSNTSQILPSQQAIPLLMHPSNSPVHCVEVSPLHQSKVELMI